MFNMGKIILIDRFDKIYYEKLINIENYNFDYVLYLTCNYFAYLGEFKKV